MRASVQTTERSARPLSTREPQAPGTEVERPTRSTDRAGASSHHLCAGLDEPGPIVHRLEVAIKRRRRSSAWLRVTRSSSVCSAFATGTRIAPLDASTSRSASVLPCSSNRPSRARAAPRAPTGPCTSRQPGPGQPARRSATAPSSSSGTVVARVSDRRGPVGDRVCSQPAARRRWVAFGQLRCRNARRLERGPALDRRDQRVRARCPGEVAVVAGGLDVPEQRGDAARAGYGASLLSWRRGRAAARGRALVAGPRTLLVLAVKRRAAARAAAAGDGADRSDPGKSRRTARRRR